MLPGHLLAYRGVVMEDSFVRFVASLVRNKYFVQHLSVKWSTQTKTQGCVHVWRVASVSDYLQLSLKSANGR